MSFVPRAQPAHVDYTGDDQTLARLFADVDEMFTILFDDLKLVSALGGSGGTDDDLEVGVDVEAWSAELDALAALSTTGILVRTGTASYALRTLTAGANITITNGDGVSGDPTIAVTGISSGIGAAVALTRVFLGT